MADETLASTPLVAQPGKQPTPRRTRAGRLGYGLLVLLTALGLSGVGLFLRACALGRTGFATSFLSLHLGIVTLFLGLAWDVVSRRRRESRGLPPSRRLFMLWMGLTAALLAVEFTYWPMRLAFVFQRGPLEELARRVERGDVPKGPVHLGFYTVTLAEARPNGVVCLWICPEGQRCIGFGRCRVEEVPKNFYNLNVHVALAERWQFIEED